MIRVWESETGKLINALVEHTGWVTCMYYWWVWRYFTSRCLSCPMMMRIP